MKFLNLFENITAFACILVISTISIATVLSLNPAFVSSSQGKVAGISGSNNVQTESIIGVVSQIPAEIVHEEFNETYVFTIESLKEAYAFSFVSFKNFSENEGSTRIEVQFPQSLESTLRVELVDNIDRLILSSPTLGKSQRTVTVQPQSSRNFSLEISSTEDINFPFEIEISIL